MLIDDQLKNINLLQERENDMETATVENDLLRLPEKIAKRLRGRRIEIAEIKERDENNREGIRIVRGGDKAYEFSH